MFSLQETLAKNYIVIYVYIFLSIQLFCFSNSDLKLFFSPTMCSSPTIKFLTETPDNIALLGII